MQNWWDEYPWRMIQTNMREIDMIDIDARKYVDKLKEFNANVVLINTSGIIASYKTSLPFHYQSPFLQGDSLETIIELCHKEGIKVIARTDFSKIRRDLYEKNPDWAYISPVGKIVDYNGDIHACINGEYQQKYSIEIMKETITKLKVDGIFFNMGGYITRDYSGNYYGICHCDNCKRLYREMYGSNLPNEENIEDENYRKYKLFQEETLKQHKMKIESELKNINPNLIINNLDLFRRESNTEYGRELPKWQYSASSNTKWIKTSYETALSSNTTVDFIGFFYRHVAVSPYQQELRLWQNLANCGGLDYYLIGRLDNHKDRSGFEAVKKVFGFHKKYEKEYVGLKSCSDILLIMDQAGRGKNEDKGFIRFLTEKHFMFDELIKDRIEYCDLDKYKVIILPDIRYLSDNQIKLLDEYVLNGGILISSLMSAMYDDRYDRREEYPLKSMGIEKIKNIRNDMTSAMFLLDEKDCFPSFDDIDLVYFGDTYIFAKYKEGSKQYLKLIPPHNYGPPERCYFEKISDLPGLNVNSYGEGRGIFIPFKAGELFYKEGHTNTIEFINDVLSQIANVESIDTNVSPMVEITHSRNEKEKFELIQFVNATGHFGNTFYKPVTLSDIYVKFRFDKEPKKVYSLFNDKELRYEYKDGYIKIFIDKLEQYEAIKIY